MIIMLNKSKILKCITTFSKHAQPIAHTRTSAAWPPEAHLTFNHVISYIVIAHETVSGFTTVIVNCEVSACSLPCVLVRFGCRTFSQIDFLGPFFVDLRELFRRLTNLHT